MRLYHLFCRVVKIQRKIYLFSVESKRDTLIAYMFSYFSTSLTLMCNFLIKGCFSCVSLQCLCSSRQFSYWMLVFQDAFGKLLQAASEPPSESK